MKILHVIGARPNFMKVAPVMAALSRRAAFEQILIHTGQHYDKNMSDVFWEQLGLPHPDVNLEVGSGTHAQQTAEILSRFERVVNYETPDLVLVYGDVNSTLAAALVCSKLLVPVGHVEAGLRSFDRTMPEEINRVLTDQISDLLFTHSAEADKNLLREGNPGERIHRVGNVMIDTLVRLLPRARESTIPMQLGLVHQAHGEAETRRDGDQPRLHMASSPYGVVTLHRPMNVDDPSVLSNILTHLTEISWRLPLVFPVHPRTRKRIKVLSSHVETGKLRFVEPLGYIDFLALMEGAKLVITDSGGVQEEATFLGVPCLTLRENTERAVTVAVGTNILVGCDMGRVKTEVDRILKGEGKRGAVPPLWDGRAAERIADVIAEGRGG